MSESPEYIVKRSGQKVTFNAAKIRDAIRKAGNAVADEEITEEKVVSLTNQVLDKIPKDFVPTVEQVQDIVEEVLIANVVISLKAFAVEKKDGAGGTGSGAFPDRVIVRTRP